MRFGNLELLTDGIGHMPDRWYKRPAAMGLQLHLDSGLANSLGRLSLILLLANVNKVLYKEMD